AQRAFGSREGLAILLMFILAVACTITAIGLWCGTQWGTRLAIVILALNLIGELFNGLLLHDYRALIGLPIGGAMIAYLVWNVGGACVPRRSRPKGRSHD